MSAFLTRVKECTRIAYRSLDQLHLYVEVAGTGIRAASTSTSTLELIETALAAINKPSKFTDEDERQRAFEVAKKREAFAQHQIASGNSYLHELASIRLWSILEACVDDILMCYMENPHELVDKSILDKVKVSLADMLLFSLGEHSESITDLVKDHLRASLKPGVGKFETLLAPCGLGGPINPDVSKALLELSVVRNLVVHKDGQIDSRAKELCPWLASAGEQAIKVDWASFRMYYMACHWYIGQLKLRILKLEGHQDTSSLEENLETIANLTQRDLISRPAD